MPFHQEWLITDQVVRVVFTGQLTIEDIAKSFMVSGKFIAESEAKRVHFIHDWTQLDGFPTNLNQIRSSTEMDENPYADRLGWVVIFGAQGKILRFLGDIVFQLYQIRTHMTSNLDEAIAFLEKQDPTLVKSPKLTEVEWYLEGHIIKCFDVVPEEDMIQRNRNVLKLIEAEGKPPHVHMLIDFSSSNSKDYALDVRQLVRRSTYSIDFANTRDELLRHPLFGWVVVYGVHSNNINVSGKIISMKYNYKRKEVTTIQEAIDFLKRVDSNIAKLLS